MLKQSLAAMMLLGSLIATTNADIIEYPNAETSQLFFSDITESSVFEQLPLFGAPSINGTSLQFTNPQFTTTVADGDLNFVDGRFTVEVVAKDGQSITGFELTEFGTYFGAGSDLDIFVSGIGFASAENQIYQNDFDITWDAAGSGEWTGSFAIQFDNPVNSFSFVADNQLFVRAGANSTASITKDEIALTVNTIPEPGSTMLMLGVAIGTFVRRRR